MSFHDRLLHETTAARDEFLSIPALGRALQGEIPRTLYLDFLAQAYHHVRHTCPLLAFAASRTDDQAYRDALLSYLAEENGHDEWILSDIAALGGDAEGVRSSAARRPCRAMVGFAYYAIEWASPYAMLGMVHVLEGMSTQLASRAAGALEQAYGGTDGQGFSYLVSHGELDIEHTAYFRDLVNQLALRDDEADAIIDCANMMYWLYGNIFRDLGRQLEDAHDA